MIAFGSGVRHRSAHQAACRQHSQCCHDRADSQPLPTPIHRLLVLLRGMVWLFEGILVRQPGIDISILGA
jgi:hypothetical protein